MSATMYAASASLQAQWQASRRLRLALGVAALIAVLHAVVSLAEARAAQIERYLADRALLERLQGAAADAAWTARASEAGAALAALEASMASAGSAGEAQAELQALLSGVASAAGIAAPRARSQAAVEVAGLPEVWQVVARLDVTTPAASLEALLRELAKRPWVRVERIEIRDATPAQAQLIVRAYVRKTGAAP